MQKNINELNFVDLSNFSDTGNKKELEEQIKKQAMLANAVADMPKDNQYTFDENVDFLRNSLKNVFGNGKPESIPINKDYGYWFGTRSVHMSSEKLNERWLPEIAEKLDMSLEGLKAIAKQHTSEEDMLLTEDLFIEGANKRREGRFITTFGKKDIPVEVMAYCKNESDMTTKTNIYFKVFFTLKMNINPSTQGLDLKVQTSRKEINGRKKSAYSLLKSFDRGISTEYEVKEIFTKDKELNIYPWVESIKRLT